MLLPRMRYTQLKQACCNGKHPAEEQACKLRFRKRQISLLLVTVSFAPVVDQGVLPCLGHRCGANACPNSSELEAHATGQAICILEVIYSNCQHCPRGPWQIEAVGSIAAEATCPLVVLILAIEGALQDQPNL